MRENARTRLAVLREKKPPTKAAQIRNLWPEIAAALDNGHSLKTIADCLAADGIAVSARSLSVYVGRLRKNSSANQEPTLRAKGALPGSVIPSPPPKSELVSVQTGKG